MKQTKVYNFIVFFTVLFIIIFIVYVSPANIDFLLNPYMYQTSVKKNTFDPRRTKNEDKLLMNLLKVTSDILNDNNIVWSLTSGNLLAIYRYGIPILPWDDDMDIVVDKNKNKYAVEILKKELPKHGMSIVYHKKNYVEFSDLFSSNKLYKICYSEDKEDIIKHKYGSNDWSWPFIDLFIDYPRKNQWNNPHDIYSDEEVGTINYEYNEQNIPLNYFLTGTRSKEYIKEQNILDMCYDKPFSHKYDLHFNNVMGNNNIPCEDVKFIRYKT